MRTWARAGILGIGVLAVIACSGSSSGGGTADDGDATCSNVTTDSRFPDGDPNGNADPFGAKAAGQARAGIIADSSLIKRAADARNRVLPGDFVIANDKIAAYVASARKTDGYVPYGGKVIAIDTVGADGKPEGLSEYGETLISFSRQALNPDTVTVMNDGSDGQAAVIRAQGKLKDIPFLDPFKALFPREYPYPVAIDYVLEPHAEKLLVRMNVINTSATDAETFTGMQILGMFHSYRGQVFSDGNGFAEPDGDPAWVGFDGATSSFAIRGIGSTMKFGASISGFQYFILNGLSIDTCSQKTVDYAEIIPAKGGIDNVRAAIDRIDQAPERTITGTLKEDTGAPIANAYVHALTTDGKYVTRAVTDAMGAFALHVPASGALNLQSSAPGYALSPATPVADGATTATLTQPAHGTLHVTAADKLTGPGLPVRVQVVPKPALAAIPDAYGVSTEDNGRLWQSFAMNGDISLAVPPGMHEVIVSRGYEWELGGATVAATSGKTTEVPVTIEHSVDSTGVMCADFHIHSYFSVDAGDTVTDKVKSAIADGLEIPVSSEHEWIIDFQPIIESLGVAKWAYGFPSEELTTFTFGHFGVVPKLPDSSQVNLGAVDWVDKMPSQIFDEVNALPEKPVLIINHPVGTTFMGYFSAAQFDTDSAAGKNAMLWSDHFEAIEVWNDSSFDDNKADSVADWMSMLAAGKNVWGIGNSDSHHIKSSPVGYPRNCIQFGHDDPTKLSANTVRDGIRAGAFNVSGGLYMTVKGPDGKGPGQTSTAGKYAVTVQAPSWLSATTLEAWIDGKAPAAGIPLTAATGGGTAHVYNATVDVQPGAGTGRHFVVFHAKGTSDLAPLHPGRKPFAVSNPIFF